MDRRFFLTPSLRDVPYSSQPLSPGRSPIEGSPSEPVAHTEATTDSVAQFPDMIPVSCMPFRILNSTNEALGLPSL
jgi:hypothetical protein